MTRCSNGHFFDGEKFQSCPHCVYPKSVGDIQEIGEIYAGPEVMQKRQYPLSAEDSQEIYTVYSGPEVAEIKPYIQMIDGGGYKGQKFFLPKNFENHPTIGTIILLEIM